MKRCRKRFVPAPVQFRVLAAKPAVRKLTDRNQQCNFVPEGFNKYVERNRKLYVAQRASSNAEINLKGTSSGRTLWGIFEREGGPTVASGGMDEHGHGAIDFSPTKDRQAYIVRIGCDTLLDGRLDWSEAQDESTPFFTVFVITQNDYNESVGKLTAYANQHSRRLPTASRLLRAFLTGTVPPEASTVFTFLPAANSRLTHVAGAPFSSQCQAVVPEYIFLAGSSVSFEVAKSKTLDEARCKFLKSKKQEVEQFFNGTNVQVADFTWEWIADISYLRAFGDYDLFLAFGRVRIKATLFARISRKNLEIVSLRTVGEQKDLYDFDYERPLLNRQGATVQIGWQAQPGNVGGGIFLNEVEIDSLHNRCRSLR